jgi:hypothetical protein
MTRTKGFVLVLLLASVLVLSPMLADDLTGASKFLCTAVQVTACADDGECTGGAPWDFNIPQFIEIDLEAKTLSTTKASGENRSTKIKNLERDEGLIILQGYERGRAFSFAIDEQSGMASIAVARDGIGVVVFAACTPR